MEAPSTTIDKAVSPQGRPNVQRRIVAVLVIGQILGGIGLGAALSIGSLLAVQVSGSPAWAGMAATMNTLGAALLAIPLARLAMRHGRRMSLALGALLSGAGAGLVIVAALIANFPMLLIGLALLGAGTAVNLQARFAATDMADVKTRARDLSIVIWSTTIGAVAGPNLFEPGEVVGRLLHLPTLTGSFVMTVVAQVAAAIVYLFALRPDPLSNSLRTGTKSEGRATSGFTVLRRNPAARYAVTSVALSHGTMVGLMSMTPVHLREHGASLALVGITISFHLAGMYGLSPLFGWLADSWGRTPVLLTGQGMLLVSLVLAWLAPNDMVTPSLVLLGLGWSASLVSGSALVSEATNAAERPPLQGVSDLIMNLTGAGCAALAGPALAGMGYSGLGAASLVLVAIVIGWTAIRATSSRRSRDAHAGPSHGLVAPPNEKDPSR